MRYLFTVQTSNDLGLLTRSLPIAAELTRRGHQVVFSNPAAAPSKLIVEVGFENLLLKHPLHYITALQARGELTLPGLYRQIRSGMMHQEFGSPWDLLIRLLGVMPTHFHKPVAEVQSFDHLCAILFLDNERYARGELEAWVQFIEAYQPDGIIDSLNPLACLAARILKKPLVTLLQADMHPGNPGVMWWKQPSADVPSPAPVLSKLAQEHGLPGIQKTEELFLGDLTLILGIPETDPIPPGARGTYIGPVLWQKPGVKLPAQIESLNPDFPLVWLYLGNPRYFSFRTPYDTEATIQTCMEAMADEPVQVVLTTGNHPLPERLLPLAGNFSWFPFVPGLEMSARSQLLIHHGGYGSCQTGLSTGTPAVILPNFSERESNARRVVQAGAGEMILPGEGKGRKGISAEVLRAKARKVLNTPLYRENAQRIAREMAGYGGASLAADLIEGLD